MAKKKKASLKKCQFCGKMVGVGKRHEPNCDRPMPGKKKKGKKAKKSAAPKGKRAHSALLGGFGIEELIKLRSEVDGELKARLKGLGGLLREFAKG